MTKYKPDPKNLRSTHVRNYGARGAKKSQVTLTIDNDILDDVDALAELNDCSRSKAVNHILRSHSDAMSTVQELHEDQKASDTIAALLNVPAVKDAIEAAFVKVAPATAKKPSKAKKSK